MQGDANGPLGHPEALGHLTRACPFDGDRHHDVALPPASGRPNEAPDPSLGYVPYTRLPAAALQLGLSIIDGGASTEAAEHETVSIVTFARPAAYPLNMSMPRGRV